MLRRRAAASVAALTLALSACSSSSDEGGDDAALDGLTVSGEFGEEPTIEVDGLDVDDVESTVVVAGDGAELTSDNAALYRFVIAKAADGETVAGNYSDNEPRTMVLSEEPDVIGSELEGATIGSRIAIAMPVRELLGEEGAPQVGLTADDDLVMVFDLVEEAEAPTPPLEGPEGTEVDPPADAPKVEEEDGDVTGLDFSDAPKKAPDQLQVIPLIEGEGPRVEEDDAITVDYYGAVWGSDEAFDESYGRGEPAAFTLSQGGLIDGWVQGLQGVPVGSRVLLVIPSELGYGKQGSPPDIPGDSTLVFVIDVLGAEG